MWNLPLFDVKSLAQLILNFVPIIQLAHWVQIATAKEQQQLLEWITDKRVWNEDTVLAIACNDNAELLSRHPQWVSLVTNQYRFVERSGPACTRLLAEQVSMETVFITSISTITERNFGILCSAIQVNLETRVRMLHFALQVDDRVRRQWLITYLVDDPIHRLWFLNYPKVGINLLNQCELDEFTPTDWFSHSCAVLDLDAMSFFWSRQTTWAEFPNWSSPYCSSTYQRAFEMATKLILPIYPLNKHNYASFTLEFALVDVLMRLQNETLNAKCKLFAASLGGNCGAFLVHMWNMANEDERKQLRCVYEKNEFWPTETNFRFLLRVDPDFIRQHVDIYQHKALQTGNVFMWETLFQMGCPDITKKMVEDLVRGDCVQFLKVIWPACVEKSLLPCIRLFELAARKKKTAMVDLLATEFDNALLCSRFDVLCRTSAIQSLLRITNSTHIKREHFIVGYYFSLFNIELLTTLLYIAPLPPNMYSDIQTCISKLKTTKLSRKVWTTLLSHGFLTKQQIWDHLASDFLLQTKVFATIDFDVDF